MLNRLRLGIALLVVVVPVASSAMAHAAPADRAAVSSPRVTAGSSGARTPGPAFVPGELLVRFRPGVTEQRRRALRLRASAGLLERLALPGTELLRLRGRQTVRGARRYLSAQPEVLVAEPNFARQVRAAPTALPLRYAEQWGVANAGQPIGPNADTGSSGADVDAERAWDITQGSSATRIAVVDTGIDYTHPALRDNVVRAPGGTADLIDDDGDPFDYVNGHGTHVAGVIAAQGTGPDNVVTGLNWRAQVVPVRVLDEEGKGNAADIIDGLAYAGRNARVVNASFGAYTPSVLERATIARFPRTLFVFASDNGGRSSDESGDYPCDYTLPNIICVAASDNDDARASFSNWGGGAVDIAAPGRNVLSTLPGSVIFEVNDVDPVATQVPVDAIATNDDMARWTPGRAAGSPRTRTWGWSSETIQGERLTELADSPGGGNNYAPNSDGWIASPRMLLAGRQHCRVGFGAFTDSESGSDRLTIEATGNDGVTWKQLGAAISGLGGSSQARRLPTNMHTDGARIRFHFVSDRSVNGDGAFVDAIRVACGDGRGPYTATGAYGYESGTSMATPHVAGAAGLVYSAYPAASVSFVRNALLAGVDPHPAGTWSSARPATAVAAQGRLSARGALDAAAAQGQELLDVDLDSPGVDERTTDRTPMFSWYPSGSVDGVTGYRVYVDGQLVADLANQRQVVTTGRISWAPSSRRRLALGYHNWRVVAYQGADTASSPTRDFKVTTSPRVTLALTGARRRADTCGASVATACRYGARGRVGVSGTIGETRFSEGAAIELRFFRARPGSRRFPNRPTKVVRVTAAGGNYPEQSQGDGMGARTVALPKGTWKVRAHAPISDLLLAANSRPRYLVVG